MMPSRADKFLKSYTLEYMRSPLFGSTNAIIGAVSRLLWTTCLVWVLVPVGAVAAESAVAEPPSEAGPVVHIRIDTIIHPVAAQFLIESLEHAEEMQAAVLVVELDTPGGLLTSTREMTTAMLSSPVPVVVWVAPSGAQAASAGFFLLMAADVAAMAPSTNTGAAHPVGGGGEEIEGVMADKVEQDAAATIRSLAARNGRDEKLAEAAVVESRSFTDQEALEAGLSTAG